MRVGAVAKKLGMSSLFRDDGTKIPVTLLKVEPSLVLGVSKTASRNVQVAVGTPKNKQKKPQAQFFAKHKTSARFLTEFRVSSDDKIPTAKSTIGANHFAVGQKVDVQATSKGKGFAGVMKRHNFAGLSASHGVSISHRSAGSTGQCQDPGRTFKGKKMAGRMGGGRVTIQNLEVVAVDETLLVLKGAVPGATNGYVRVQDAVKLPNQKIEPEAEVPTTSATTSAEADQAGTTTDNKPEATPPETKQEAKPEAKQASEGAKDTPTAETKQAEAKQETSQAGDKPEVKQETSGEGAKDTPAEGDKSEAEQKASAEGDKSEAKPDATTEGDKPEVKQEASGEGAKDTQGDKPAVKQEAKDTPAGGDKSEAEQKASAGGDKSEAKPDAPTQAPEENK